MVVVQMGNIFTDNRALSVVEFCVVVVVLFFAVVFKSLKLVQDPRSVDLV